MISAFDVNGFEIKQFPQPANVVVIKWIVETGNHFKIYERAVLTAEQYDAVIAEYCAALASVYRPLK